jgi:exonuclease III
MRGTAFLVKEPYQLTNVERSPTGRTIAATLNGTRVININAPASTGRRAQREHFYNQELSDLLDTSNPALILGGDFNCVLEPADATEPRAPVAC